MANARSTVSASTTLVSVCGTFRIYCSIFENSNGTVIILCTFGDTTMAFENYTGTATCTLCLANPRTCIKLDHTLRARMHYLVYTGSVQLENKMVCGLSGPVSTTIFHVHTRQPSRATAACRRHQPCRTAWLRVTGTHVVLGIAFVRT